MNLTILFVCLAAVGSVQKGRVILFSQSYIEIFLDLGPAAIRTNKHRCGLHRVPADSFIEDSVGMQRIQQSKDLRLQYRLHHRLGPDD